MSYQEEEEIQTAMARSGAVAAAMARSGAVAAAEERRRRAAATPTAVRRRPVVLSTEQRHQAEIAHLQEVIDRLEAKIEKLSESLSAARIAELEAALADRDAIIAALLVDAAPQQSARPAPAAARPASARTIPSSASARPVPSASARPVPSVSASARPATGSSTSHFVSEASIYTASMKMTRETTIRGGVTSSSTTRVVRRFP